MPVSVAASLLGSGQALWPYLKYLVGTEAAAASLHQYCQHHVALPEVLDKGHKLRLPHCVSTANITWPYLKYLIRDRSCAVGLCLESLLRSLTVASCRGTGTRGSTLWSWSSSCNSRVISTLVTICTTVCHIALDPHSVFTFPLLFLHQQ